jgi:hypothetical protein
MPGSSRSSCTNALLAAAAALAFVAAGPDAPSPAPASSPPAAAGGLSIACKRTPLWLFPPDVNRPQRSATPDATLGARFGYVSGPRATLESTVFYETDVPAIENGYRGQHYWVSDRCAVRVP